MKYSEIFLKQKPVMVKKALSIFDTLGPAAFIVGAAAIAGSLGIGAGVGYGLGKLTLPSIHDSQNILKQQLLARLRADNSSQKLMAQKLKKLRDIRNTVRKPARMFG